MKTITGDFMRISSRKNEDTIRRMTEAGLLNADKDGIYPTTRGFDLQNILIGAFL